MDKLVTKIEALAEKYSLELYSKVQARVKEMETDDRSHHLIYEAFGIDSREGDLIDIYQNKGRLFYKRAGEFLEGSAILCFQYKFKDSKKLRIPKGLGKKGTFEIDCLVDKDAYEIKWKDATTDGDHVNKERARIECIKSAGYKPIRLMFFRPNRKNSIRIQNDLAAVYKELDGEYYSGKEAWDHLKQVTGVDLLTIVEKFAAKKTEEKNKNAKTK